MKIRACLPAVLLFIPLSTVPAGITDSSSAPPEENKSPLLGGEDLSLGGVLFPHIHFQAAYGRTSFEELHEFAAGHHDPFSDGWTVQGVELGLSGRFSDHVEGFATWHGFWDSASPHSFDSEFEEYFLKLKNLPGGLEVRGGQYLNRFGLHNATHLHAWDWVDNYLVSGRMLGDDGLTSRGGEVTWRLPVKWSSTLSASFGSVLTEVHEHETHDDHDDEPLYEAEGAMFADQVTSILWTNSWNLNDFHQFRGGLSAAWGDNTWGRTTQVYGAHVQYEWRENGLEPGGDYLRWRTEVLYRDAEVRSGHLPGEDHEEDEPGESLPGTLSDWGLYSSVAWGKALRRGVLESALRYEYLSGEHGAGLPARHRISPGLTWYLDSVRTGFVRFQANFDDVADHGHEESVWLSFGLNLGGAEVR
jgi:hypothetical protein